MSVIRIVLNVGSLILVGILGWLIVRIGLGVTQPESLYGPDPIIAPVRTASAGKASVTHDFSTDPFAFGEIVIAPLELIEDAPETTLNLKLIGIVSESNATFRLADGKNKAVKLSDAQRAVSSGCFRSTGITLPSLESNLSSTRSIS